MQRKWRWWSDSRKFGGTSTPQEHEGNLTGNNRSSVEEYLQPCLSVWHSSVITQSKGIWHSGLFSTCPSPQNWPLLVMGYARIDLSRAGLFNTEYIWSALHSWFKIGSVWEKTTSKVILNSVSIFYVKQILYFLLWQYLIFQSIGRKHSGCLTYQYLQNGSLVVSLEEFFTFTFLLFTQSFRCCLVLFISD